MSTVIKEHDDDDDDDDDDKFKISQGIVEMLFRWGGRLLKYFMTAIYLGLYKPNFIRIRRIL